ARFHVAGNLVLLEDQDRSLWNREAIRAATRLIERAAARGRPGPYQVQAAIAAVHAESPSWNDTDWWQVLLLYELLLQLAPTPVARLNRAIALERVSGAADALWAVDQLAAELSGYHLFHAARGRLLDLLGRREEAKEAFRIALGLTANPAERALLER